MWGKVLGALFGFMVARIPGALLGFLVGHLFDKGYGQDFNQKGGFTRFFDDQDDMQKQAIFFHSLFSVMGHVAKADGQVRQEEIDMASQLMNQMGLEGELRREAQQAFREGKEVDFPLKQTLMQFRSSCHNRRDVIQVFLEILIQAACVDGKIDAKEQAILEKAARYLGFHKQAFLHLLAMYEAEMRFRQSGNRQQQKQSHYSTTQSLEDAYRILGVKRSDNMTTVKKAYKKLMMEHHPDKLIAKGLPKQAMEMAKAKTQDIQAAYELIKQQHA